MGALISAVGGLWVFVAENERIGSPAVVVVVGAFITAGGALWSSSERTKFERELRDRSDEIADLNRKIAASVTGGDSFCYAAMGSVGVAGENAALLMVVHQGEYPLYDVNLRIVDLPEFRRAVDAGQLSLAGPGETTVDVGNMSARSARPIQVWQLPDGDQASYNVFFNARNGFWSQSLRLKRVGGEWKSATQVSKDIMGDEKPPLLHEQVDPEFPLNEQGEVEW